MLVVDLITLEAASKYETTGLIFRWYAAINLQHHTIATPTLDYRDLSNINIGDILNDGEEAWVGYFQMDVSLEYFGM